MRAAVLTLSAVVIATALPLTPPTASASVARESGAARATARLPLAGRTVVLDAGHQLGNARFPAQTSAPVDAGGFSKPCNTTGTSTNAGYPEATFAFEVARRLRHRLERRGATVVMTRTRNTHTLWGPCVDVRGRLGNPGFAGLRRAADLKVSIHGDGAAASSHGFHVIVATHHRRAEGSIRYARATRAALLARGIVSAGYVGDGSGLVRRGDLGTLNLSRIPTAMVELGNMHNAHDARVMSSTRGQKRYAAALLGAIRRSL